MRGWRERPEKEIYIFLFPCQYKLHYLICVFPVLRPRHPPSLPPPIPPWRPNICCHLSIKPWQTVTLLGIVRNDLNRPCVFQVASAAGSLPGDWLVKEVPCQIKKIGRTGSFFHDEFSLSVFESEGAPTRAVIVFLWHFWQRVSFFSTSWRWFIRRMYASVTFYTEGEHITCRTSNNLDTIIPLTCILCRRSSQGRWKSAWWWTLCRSTVLSFQPDLDITSECFHFSTILL